MSGTRATLRNAGTPLSLTGATVSWASTPPVAADDMTPVEPPLQGEDLLTALFGVEGFDPSTYGRFSSETPSATRLSFERPTNPLLAVGGFGSRHPGGSQFALGDGSVRFLPETISPTVFANLAHRADGEIMLESGF